MSAEHARLARSVAIPADMPRRTQARALLMLLADMARPDSGAAWPSVPTMADYLLVDARNAQRALRELEQAGLIAAADPRRHPLPAEWWAIPANRRPRAWVVLPGLSTGALPGQAARGGGQLPGVALPPPPGVALPPPKAETVSGQPGALDTAMTTRGPADQPQPVDMCLRCGRYAPRMGNGEHTPHTTALPDGSPVACLPAERAQVDHHHHAQLARGLLAHARARAPQLDPR